MRAFFVTERSLLMCGIAAAFNVPDASYVVSLMLKRLQHRGRSGAGIAASDGGRIRELRGACLVDQLCDRIDLPRALPGNAAVGHVRYATAGDPTALANVQPIVANTRLGTVAIAHNGNLTNYDELRSRLEGQGAIFSATTDTETFLHLATRVLEPFPPDLKASGPLLKACGQAEGAYALAILTADSLIAARDPYGFRPLVYAPYGDGWILASETCALDLFMTGPVVEVAAGQMLQWRAGTDGRPKVDRQTIGKSAYGRKCSFELIYFSRPDSEVFGLSADRVRKRLGAALAAVEPTQADAVIPVPDSSNAMALAYARASGIPFEFGLIRDHNTGRTFITPGQDARIHGVRMKLNAVPAVVRGKRIVLIDDSIVRGTTMKKVVAILREAGAAAIHVRVASPPFVHPCRWGIDTPSFEELAAAQQSIEALRAEIGADSLAYLPVGALREAIGDPDGSGFCTTCFTGALPY
jgi:amidophosphoribosyltransferase